MLAKSIAIQLHKLTAYTNNMALTELELQKAKQLQSQGYTADEVKEYIGAQRVGRPSVIMEELEQRKKTNESIEANSLSWREIVGAPAKFLAPDAIDVFGSALARRGIGTDTSTNVTREYIEEPTARQYAGAALQTAGLVADVGLTVGSLGAVTPLTLGRNVALGAGLGYLYDVGDDLIAQESLQDTLTPGFATIVGGAAPLAFAGLGAGIRSLTGGASTGLADDTARTVAPAIRQSASEGVQEGVEKGTKNVTETAVSGIGESARNLGNRVTRSGQRIQEIVEKNAERASLRQNARPAVIKAIDDGLDINTITRIENAPPASKSAYRAVVEEAEGANPLNAEKVSGSYATEMYKIARNRQKEVGQSLGEARRALGSDPINPRVTNNHFRTFKETMTNNRMNFRSDGTVDFSTQKFTDEEQAVISKIWERMAKNPNPTPVDVDEMSQFLSKLQYQTNVTDKIGNVYIDVVDAKTGTMQPQSIFNYIRNTYDSMLEQIDTSGEIARLRKEYAQVKSVTDPIEGSWLNGLDLAKTTDEELADAMSLALRRLDGRAKSRTTYGQMYGALDKYARAHGYKGADAADVSNFYMTTVEPLYKGTTPEASFRGGITGGIRSVFENVFDLGKADVTDKQKALRGLLDLGDKVPTPVQAVDNFFEAPKKRGFIEKAKDALKDQRGSVQLKGESTSQKLKNLSESSAKTSTLSKEGVEVVNKFLKHIDGTAPLSGDELATVKQQAQSIADAAGDIKTTGTDKTLADGLANKYSKQISSFKQSATTQTTDLLEEAKKYKSADEFVKAQKTFFHGTTKKAKKSIEKSGFKPGSLDDSELGAGVYITDDRTPAALFDQDLEPLEVFIDDLKTYELPSFRENPQQQSQEIAQAIISRDTLPPTLKGMTVDELAERITSTFSDNPNFWLEKAGYDGVTDASSQIRGQIAVFDPKKIKTKSQLEDIWKQANAQ